MKFFIVTCLLAVAAAAPIEEQEYEGDNRGGSYSVEDNRGGNRGSYGKELGNAETVVDERSDSGDGNFNYKIETSNNIYEERVGVPGEKGQTNMNGVFRFTFEDGTTAEITYVADETGYKPVSNLLPTPHPLPAHVHELLRIAEEQRAAGITFDGSYNPSQERVERAYTGDNRGSSKE